jgi:hypothetical protein
MATTRQRVDKAPCQQLCRAPWEPCQQPPPRSQERHVPAVIDALRGGGTLEAGSPPSLGPPCLDETRVAGRCTSRFGLSCGKGSGEAWGAHIGRTLSEGVAYGPVGLTRPEALPRAGSREGRRWAALMPCGGTRLRAARAWGTQVQLAAGSGVGLETAGRSGPWPPPRPRLRPSGGGRPPQPWREVDALPLQVWHTPWPSSLCPMRQPRGGTRAIPDQRDALGRTSPRGLVASVAEGKGPAGSAGWASSGATDVVSPPRSLCRILRSDGQRGRYGENEHKTKQRQEAEVSALTGSGRLGQQRRPQGCHRRR